jgi:hypothetical protein
MAVDQSHEGNSRAISFRSQTMVTEMLPAQIRLAELRIVNPYALSKKRKNKCLAVVLQLLA